MRQSGYVNKSFFFSPSPSYTLLLQLMHRQRFFMEVLPKVVELFPKATEGMRDSLAPYNSRTDPLPSSPAERSHLLLALGHLLLAVPRQVLLGELNTVSVPVAIVC